MLAGGVNDYGSCMASDLESYFTYRNWIDGAVHELPSGVLWGANGATIAECAEMQEGLDEFEALCRRLELTDHTDYIEACRWHFDHYPHYLSRRRHFASYETYVQARKGPIRVPLPQSPRRPDQG